MLLATRASRRVEAAASMADVPQRAAAEGESQTYTNLFTCRGVFGLAVLESRDKFLHQRQQQGAVRGHRSPEAPLAAETAHAPRVKGEVFSSIHTQGKQLEAHFRHWDEENTNPVSHNYEILSHNYEKQDLEMGFHKKHHQSTELK